MSPNSFTNVNNVGTSPFSTNSLLTSGNATNIDSDYWSSSSSSSHVKQTAPNCSTSGISSAFDGKLVSLYIVEPFISKINIYIFFRTGTRGTKRFYYHFSIPKDLKIPPGI